MQRGRDVVVVLDTSKSMLAEDIQPSRMAKAKREIDQLIVRLQGDRIGLVSFSGEASISCPLTIDYAAARLFLSEIDVGTGSHGGNESGACDRSCTAGVYLIGREFAGLWC